MYKLSKTQRHHAGDVKGVKFTEHAIFSVSRDGTATLGQEPVLQFGVYLNSCATRAPYVYAGAQDGTIAATNTQNLSDNMFFMGHQANVCALDARGTTLVSGSWDKSARVWNTEDPSAEPQILTNHTEAVWAVLVLENGDILTASADKRILRWKHGKKIQEYKGHTDAVRGLCSIDANTFASCSNDNTVRIWTLAGAHTVLSGHTSFVYSVAYANNTLFSAGEDRTVRVWREGNLVQTITLPSVSQWSVDARGTEFVVGSSDHSVRVFSCDESKWALQTELDEFDAAVSGSSLGEDQVGKIDESQLKPESHIQKPGKEGEIALVKSNGIVTAHQYSAGSWSKVGQVMGKSSDGAKVSYNGKQYDYVFDVDIREGEPPLKLPFNNSDNPYAVAESFVAENELPAVYVEQVVQFLIRNSETKNTIGNLETSSAPTQVPAAAASSAPSSDPVPELLRYNTPLAMTTFKLEPLVRAFNECADRYDSDIPIDSLLTSLPASSQELVRSSLDAIEAWGTDDMLPALDTLRLGIPGASNLSFLPVATALLSCLDEDVPKHAMLATRGFANLLSRHDSYDIVHKYPQPIGQGLKMLSGFTEFTNPMQIAVATLCLNGAITEVAALPQYISVYAPKIRDPEAIYRMALAIGVLTGKGNKSVAQQLKGWLGQFTEKRSQDIAAAINQCA